MTKTYKDCINFLMLARARRSTVTPTGTLTASLCKSKMDYALDRVIQRVVKAIEKSGCEDKRTVKHTDAEYDHASVYPQSEKERAGLLIRIEGQLQYTPDAAKKLSAIKIAANVECNNTEITLEPYFVSVIPDDLTQEEVEAFQGFVLPEDYEIPEPDESTSKND